MLAEIDQAIAARNADGAARVVHSAKGASRSAGADELAVLLADLGAAAKAQQWDAAAAVYAQVQPAFERVKTAVMDLRA